MNANIQTAVDTIWDYLRIGNQPSGADCLLVLGSRDDRVASYAAQLTSTRSFKTIVVSGGSAHKNDLLATKWTESTEAEHFYTVMRSSGVQQEIILEYKATNTGENCKFSYKLLKEEGIKPDSILIITKPYMERRAIATFTKQWPGSNVTFQVASPQMTFENYCNEDQPAASVINIMVGDLERIIKYPELGFQTWQQVAAHVKAALKTLQNAGYTKHSLAS